MIPTYNPFISYAQHGEDVMLRRAFRDIWHGFYIDVGASDPVFHSTTKLFYDAGWSGINIEPSAEHYRALVTQRRRDINLQCAVGDREGTITFFEIPGSGLSTTDPNVADNHRKAEWRMQPVEVPLRTLGSILAEHPVPEVHFLKVDVEGAEEAVLRGADFRAVRPWILLVEATRPLSIERCDAPLRSILEGVGYMFAFFDGINSFFVAEEHRHLLCHFDRPANPLDGHRTQTSLAVDQRLAEADQRIAELQLNLAEMRASSSWRITKPIRTLRRIADCLNVRSASALENPESLRMRLASQPLLSFTRAGDHDFGDRAWDGLSFPGWLGKTTQKLTSGLCTRSQLESPAFRYWIGRLRTPFVLRRKDWEFGFILQALYERGCLQRGKRGLGFAVGEEAIPSLLASMGCDVVATDLDPNDSRAQAWAETAQLATSLDKLRRPEICPDTDFSHRVSYQHVDMNEIPMDLRDFDFTWSSCSFEHCGSIRQGLNFMNNQMKCLKPGGIAVHTTEFNLTHEDETIEEGMTVIFRRRDIDELVCSLEAAGHHVEPVSYLLGQTKDDQAVDIFPYTSIPHLKLLLFDRYVSTSVALIVRKAD
jgi:FkbM family methyltransferase